MKYLLKHFRIILSCLLVIVMFVLSACGNESNEYLTDQKTLSEYETNDTSQKVIVYSCVDTKDDKQVYTNETKYYFPLLELVQKYDNYCVMNQTTVDSVYVVNFSSRERMIQQMSTEIMSGGGPDIIILDDELPLTKLANQGLFADINPFIENDDSEYAFNINNYNKNLLDKGVYDGKRYVMPVLIEPDVAFSNEAVLKNSGLSEKDKITYDNMQEKLSDFVQADDGISYFEGYESSINLINSFIMQNIDHDKRTTSFDTEDFRDKIEFLKKLVTKAMTKTTANSIEDNSCLVSKGSFESGVFSPYDYSFGSIRERSIDDFSSGLSQWVDRIPDEYEGWREEVLQQIEDEKLAYEEKNKDAVKPVFVDGITDSKDSVRANIVCGFMINNNSKHKEKAYKFVRYCMGERMQRYITYDGNGEVYNLPVNNKAFDYVCGVMGYTKSRYQKINSKSTYMEKFLNRVSRVNIYDMADGYYTKNVIGDLVEDYLEDKITTDNFIKNLTSKTKIYLYE